ncbi:hypothetical protein GCM10023063_16720 [Arthrobacter methylotrophus]|uniref:Uncharacterized protein n=1 Tax=Arthrobacter methylotrophus TaxID=121291 RepID=A0ABV5UQH6_9MICC
MVDFDAEFAKRSEGNQVEARNAAAIESDCTARWTQARAELEDVCRSAATKLDTLGVPPTPRVDLSSVQYGRLELRPIQMEKLWALGSYSLGLGRSGTLYSPFIVNLAISEIRGRKDVDSNRGFFVSSTAQRFAKIGIGPNDSYARVAEPVQLPSAPSRQGKFQFTDAGIEFVDSDGRENLVDLIINETVKLCAGR